MSVKSKLKSKEAKQLNEYLLHKIMLYEGNMGQWALVDSFLGEEFKLRIKQVMALSENNTEKAREIHELRIRCLKSALEVLDLCPACETPEKAKKS